MTTMRRKAAWLFTGAGAPWLCVVLILVGTQVPYWFGVWVSNWIVWYP